MGTALKKKKKKRRRRKEKRKEKKGKKYAEKVQVMYPTAQRPHSTTVRMAASADVQAGALILRGQMKRDFKWTTLSNFSKAGLLLSYVPRTAT